MRSQLGRVDWRDQRGTSLTELTIVSGMLGFVMIATVMLWQKAQESYFRGSELAEAQGNLRVGLDQIAHDIRRAGRDLTGIPGFDPIPTATATTLRIRMDLDDDGTIAASSDEDVTYAFDSVNQRLTRNGQTQAESIGNVGFTYWWSPVVGSGCGAGALVSGQAPTTAERRCVRRVTVTLTGQGTIGGQTLSRTARTDVDLRAR